MRGDYYWSNIASNVYRTVRNCHSCVKTGTRHKNKRHLQLFLATRLLETVATNILDLLPKTTKDNQHVVIITERYSKLTGLVPTARITTTVVACIFFDPWVTPYGIPSYLLTYNGTQVVDKFFGSLCTNLGTKHMTTTAYHPQTSASVDRYDKTIVDRLRHFVVSPQRD